MEPHPDAPPGDNKDWTWVLTRPCPDCGLAAGELPPVAVAERAEVAAEEWVQILESSPAVEVRPEPGVWSPLEYGCHVRDVFRVFEGRLARMLTEDGPEFASWDQDATAVAARYSGQDPDVVAAELEAAARTFTDRLAAVEGSDWERRGRRSDGAEFTVATLAQYFLHDVVHHLWDVTGQTDALESLVAD